MTKIFASRFHDFSAPAIQPLRVFAARATSTAYLPDRSYLRLLPNQKSFLTYGLAEVASGKRMFGFAQYLFGSGHRGLFSMMHHQVAPIKKILSGGEILVAGHDNSVVDALKANQTSGFIFNLKQEEVPDVDNNFNLVAAALDQISLFNRSAPPVMIPWSENQSNHLYDLELGEFDIRHDLKSTLWHWQFFDLETNEFFERENIEIYIKDAETMMPHLQRDFDIIIKIMSAYQMELHLKSDEVKVLQVMAREIRATYFSNTKQCIAHFNHILEHHKNPSDPIINFHIKLQRFLRNIVDMMDQPDKLGYDFIELN